jgi:hypothetical protein
MRRWIAVIAFVEVFKIANARGEVPAFLVKGGFAIEFRFRSKARSSRDVDIHPFRRPGRPRGCRRHGFAH